MIKQTPSMSISVKRSKVNYLININIKENSKTYGGPTVGGFATKFSSP